MEGQEQWYLDSFAIEGRVIADVGANVGRLSQFFYEHGGDTARIVSIEPQPENVERIRERVAAAGADNWTVEACAVSAQPGTVRMKAIDVDYGKNSVIVDEADASEGEIREIASKVLADLVPDAQIIKLDIEGHEYAILPDAVPALDKAEVWALELHMVEGHPLQDTLALFEKHGYTLLAAGRKRDQPNGPWVSVAITSQLTWDHIPGTPSVHDGVAGLYKMLHVIAKR